MSDNNKIFVEKYVGKSKKSGKEFNAVKLCIGDWNTLIFPRSRFEAEYIFKVLDNNK